MANWNNPTLTSTYSNFVTEVKDRDVEAAVWFEGMSPTNLPTNAKRLNTATGRFEKWNGSAWVDAVATFTFPALSVAGGTNGSRFAVKGTGAFAGFDTGAASDGRIEYAYNGTNVFYTGIDSSSLMTLMARSGVSLAFGANGSEQMRLTSTGLLVGLSSALANGRLQVAGSIGLSGNTQIRQATNGDGNTLQVFATQFVAGNLNSISYSYAGGGLIASVSPGDSAVLLDTGRATSTGGRFKVLNTTSANTAISLEKDGVYTLYSNTGSGNVGIGTSSPLNRLQVNATNSTAYSSSNTLAGGVVGYFKNTSTTNSTDATIRLEPTTSGSIPACSISAVHTGGDATSALTFGTRTNGASDVTEKMRLDSAGNLGLGVTPSAWSGFKAFQANYGGFASFLSGGNIQTGVFSNVYFDGLGYKYISTNVATYYNQNNGVHQWYTAPSGTAGNAISFTQAMTLDASGNLQVKPGNIYTDATSGIFFTGTVGNFNNGIYGVGTNNVAISAGGSERARIDSSGNLIANSSVTGHWQLPRGTTAQRTGSPASGMIRFNTTLSRYEGHNGTAWSSIGGGATGGGTDDVFHENGQTVTTNYTLTTNKNAMSAGPITIASGITVTVPSGSNWVVV